MPEDSDNQFPTQAILDLAIRDLARARQQLEALREAATRPDLRAAWADVALELARRLMVTDIATARTLLDNVRRSAAAHPAEPALASAWTDAVHAMILRLAATDTGSARALLDDLERVARARPDQPKLLERWTASAKTMISHLAEADPAQARALQDKLEPGPN